MTSADAPNTPKMAFFCVVGRFRVRTLQFTAKNKKGRQNEKKWRFGVVGRPFVECARPLLRAGSELINVIRLLQNALYLLCAPC